MGKKTDVSEIIGQRFHRLEIIGDAGKDRRFATKVTVKCDCGTIKDVNLQGLRCGDIKSCGCLSRDNTKNRNMSHGLSGTKLWKLWKSIKARCADVSAIKTGG